MPETKNLTVMFTDIKGFTKKTSLKEREDIEKFLDLHEKLITPIFKEYKGRVVKTIGDAFMVVFESPTNAVLCGMKIQDMLKNYNSDPKNEERVEIRVASALPLAFCIRTPITFPISCIVVAPVWSMASLTNVRSSLSDICSGK